MTEIRINKIVEMKYCTLKQPEALLNIELRNPSYKRAYM